MPLQLPKNLFKPGAAPAQGKEERHLRFSLNIGRSSVVGCELSEHGGQLTLERIARQELIPDKALTDQLKEFIKTSGFQSKQARISLKGQGIVVRFLSFPRMTRADFASSIQFEAEKYLPFSISEVMIDFHINDTAVSKSESPTTMPVILVAVRKTEITKILDTIKSIGLQPAILDLDTFACVNAFEFANPDAKSKVVGLVDFGAQDTTFMIWNKGALVFSRDIAFGGRDVTEAIRRKLNISGQEAFNIQCDLTKATTEQRDVIVESIERLIHELSLSLTYYYNHHQGAAQIETVYVSGGFSQSSLLLELLQKKIEMPVTAWDPTTGLTIANTIKPEVLNSMKAYLPVSIGLAIRAK